MCEISLSCSGLVHRKTKKEVTKVVSLGQVEVMY